MSNLISYEKAAELARVSALTIRRRVDDGKLQKFVEGVRPRVDATQVRELFGILTEVKSPRACRTIAVSNQKGGVGKTTTTANLAAALAEESRVLAIDADPQGSLSIVLGVDPEPLKKTLYNVLVQRMPIKDVILNPALNLANLSLVPSNIALFLADRDLNNAISRDNKLKQALAPVQDDYDFILIDCPPALGIMTVNALTAASEVIIPVDMARLALAGVNQLLETIEAIRMEANPDLNDVRALANRVDNTNLSTDVQNTLRKTFGDKLYKTMIRQSVKLREAQALGVPMSIYRSRDAAAQDYAKLAAEVRNG